MKGSLIIIAFFIVGCIVGVLHIIPIDIAKYDVSLYALYALMFCVGFSIGNDPQTIQRFRAINPRLAAVTAAVSFLLPELSATDCMAVGAGFGYYSLSSIFITEYKGAELGTIALLSNILREMMTLLFAPLMVRWFGNLAPISAGGATSMDTTLPIITRYTGNDYAVVSIFHGFLVDFTVPFLVTFFCSI